MIRTTLTAVSLLTAPIAIAQSVSFSEGSWTYDGTARMGPVTLSENGEECFGPGEGNYNLSEAAASIAPGCSLVNSREIEAGYSFQMECSGDIKGELSGQITVGQEAARLNAEGWTGTEADKVVLSVAATARRISDSCRG